ncbi:MAG: hypothetical protein ABEH81_06630 [Halopenitus sp.]
MNLDELRSVQAKERRKDSLQHLRDDFYDDVAAYIADLKAARDRRAEEVEKPFADDDVRRLSDEVETAEEIAEALYERRVGKVVKLASFEAADMPVEQEGMTSQERALFDDLVARISENKSSVLDVLTGEVEPTNTGTDAAAAASSSGKSTSSSATEQGPEPEPNIATDQPAAVDPADGAGEADEPDDGTLADAMGVGGSTDDPQDGESGSVSGSDPSEPAPSPASDEPAESAPPGHTRVEPDTAPPGADDAASDEPRDSTPAEEVSTPADGRATSSNSESSEGDESQATGEESPATTDETERTTVRITADVGDIFGVDEREYDLASEDVVTLPEANAEALLQRDAAERLE